MEQVHSVGGQDALGWQGAMCARFEDSWLHLLQYLQHLRVSTAPDMLSDLHMAVLPQNTLAHSEKKHFSKCAEYDGTNYLPLPFLVGRGMIWGVDLVAVPPVLLLEQESLESLFDAHSCMFQAIPES